jgi:PKD repeat protein
MQLFENGLEVGSVSVVRYPGSPDDQSATISGLTMDMTNEYSATVIYSPLDDPINGQLWGANPCWVILTFEDGTEKRIHHTFNVRHPDTWEWNVNLNRYLVGTEITFESSAIDAGSDDLIFEWDWDDGSSEVYEYFNDGANPDPYPSPWGICPFSTSEEVSHAFAAAGDYTVKLTVVDDDGGSALISVIIDLS